MRNLYDKSCCWCKGHARPGEGQAWNYRGRWYAGCPTCLEERKGSKAKAEPKADIRIEYPCVMATSSTNVYGVFMYDTYPASSVLAGAERRTWLNEFATLEEAVKAFPKATKHCGPGYHEDNYEWLSEEEG